MKYVYCIVRDSLILPNNLPPGLCNSDVYKVSFDNISALISDVVPNEIDSSIQNVIAHQKIIDSLSSPSSSIIPCRFGALFQSDSDIIKLLENRYDVINKYLTMLDGKAEIGIKAIFKASQTAEQKSLSGKTGTDYLLKKKEKFDAMQTLEHKADELVKNLHQITSPFWVDAKVSKQITQDALVLNICYLVFWQDIPNFKRRYQEFERDNSNMKLFYTGPWAPYTFADIDFSEKKR